MTDPSEWNDQVAGTPSDRPIPGETTASAPHLVTHEADNILEVDDVTLRFGGVVALDQVAFSLKRGEIFGLIGPNGAGKTTCFNAMTGVYRPTSGEIRFYPAAPAGAVTPDEAAPADDAAPADGAAEADGAEAPPTPKRPDSAIKLADRLGSADSGVVVTGRKKHEITRMGIARTFQNIRLFPEMTALENVMVGIDAHHKTSVVGAIFRSPRHRREEREGRQKGRDLLEFVGIGNAANTVARNLAYGQQRRLEIARALGTDPVLLCLDEPAAGFNPAEKQELLALIRKIRDTGVTVLLIEHDMRLVMGVCDRLVVLEFGKKIAEGRPADVRDDPKVLAAYLGVPADAA